MQTTHAHVFVCLTTFSRSSSRLLVTIRRPSISVSKPISSSHGWRQISDDALSTFAPCTPVEESQVCVVCQSFILLHYRCRKTDDETVLVCFYLNAGILCVWEQMHTWELVWYLHTQLLHRGILKARGNLSSDSFLFKHKSQMQSPRNIATILLHHRTKQAGLLPMR